MREMLSERCLNVFTTDRAALNAALKLSKLDAPPAPPRTKQKIEKKKIAGQRSSTASAPRPTKQVRKAPKPEEPKFKPIADIPAATMPTPCVQVKCVPAGASVLIVQRPWIDLILDGRKTLEIRGKSCLKESQTIYLALSGGGGVVMGSVRYVRCHGPLTREEWHNSANQHLVAGGPAYGRKTHAWEVAEPIRFPQPVPYKQKSGPVVWVTQE